MNQPAQPSPHASSHTHTQTTSDFLVEIGLLYNWIMVNHYSLVSSPGALHNQDVIIEHVRECSPTILRVLPDQEMVLRQVCSSILRMSQTERRREREEEIWNVQDRCLSPDTCLPFTPSSHWRPGLCGVYRCRNVSRAFHLASRKQGSNQRRAQLCFRAAHETGCCFGLNSSTQAHYGWCWSTQCYKLYTALERRLEQSTVRERDFSQ